MRARVLRAEEALRRHGIFPFERVGRGQTEATLHRVANGVGQGKMVFVEIREGDKEAFFSLLDEYFRARPHLLPSAAAAAAAPVAPAGFSPQSNTAASFAARTLAHNPAATQSLVSSAFKYGVAKDSPASHAASNPHVQAAVGRAVSSGLSAWASSPPPNTTSPPAHSPPAKPPPVSGLVQSKRLGSLDTTSKGAFLTSMIKPKPAPPEAAPLPPAFPSHHANLPPPPRRTVAAEVEPEPEYEPAQEEEVYEEAVEAHPGEEEEGEWVEALYDYEGDPASDVSLRAGERFRLVERPSNDWWKGEVGGRTGLFPASYVRVL